MPIKIMSDLPSREILERENVFVMDEGRAEHQDIRPIRIGILNLMPMKITVLSLKLKIRNCSCCVHLQIHHYRLMLPF